MRFFAESRWVFSNMTKVTVKLRNAYAIYTDLIVLTTVIFFMASVTVSIWLISEVKAVPTWMLVDVVYSTDKQESASK